MTWVCCVVEPPAKRISERRPPVFAQSFFYLLVYAPNFKTMRLSHPSMDRHEICT